MQGQEHHDGAKQGHRHIPAPATEPTPIDHPAKDSHHALRGPGARELIGAAPLILVGLLLLVSVWWDGAFDLRYWAPLTLLSLALLVALALAGTLSLPQHGALVLAVAALWAFAAYALLSAAWAESAADAWEGAARAICYAGLFTLAVATPAYGAGLRWVGTGLIVGVVAIGLVTEVRLLAGDTGGFLAARLNDPIGYRNGTAALFSFGAWPLVGFAARRGCASGIRAAALASAVLLCGLAFLTQSRGMLVGLACGGAVSLAIGPDRLRRSWLAIATVVVIALGSGALLTPYHASDSGTGIASADDIQHAGSTLFLLCVASFLFSLFAFVFDNGLRKPEQVRGLRATAASALIVLLAGLGIGALAKIGNPVSYAEDKWDEFTQVETSAASGTRYGTVGGPRYDIWRVAVEQFREAPLVGAGEGNYHFAYYRERRTDRNLADPHSLPLAVLAETGLVGVVLLGMWLAALAVAIAGLTRRAEVNQRVWISGLAAAGTVVIAQSAVDWLWLIPALFGLAVLALGLAARDEEEDVRPRPTSLASRFALAAALGAALISVGALFLSNTYVRKARHLAPKSPQAALTAARHAADFNPVSVTPLYLQASALEAEGNGLAARRALNDALDLEPSNFVTLALLGDLEARAGNGAAARRYYRRALALNPRDTGLRKLSRGEGT
jgi:O-antigen ligase